MIRNTLIVGGANGIGLGIATALAERDEVEKIYIVDFRPIDEKYQNKKFVWNYFNLDDENYDFFSRFTDINCLIVTAGFGSLKLFKDVEEYEIDHYFRVNTFPAINLAHRFYNRLEKDKDFYFGVLVSIAGFMSSPYFSIYGASKAALKIFIESVNVELKKSGSQNRILNVSPGSIRGTSFNGEKTDLNVVIPIAKEIITRLENKDDLFIPQYEEIFKEVLERYHQDFRAEGDHSYDYKKKRLETL